MSGSMDSGTALVREHFRYAPVSLIDDIINSINHLGYKVIEAVEQGLLGAPLSDLGFLPQSGSETQNGENHALGEKAKHEIENGVHQFETLIEATIDKNFDKLEVVALRSILAIPEELRDWIRLRDYEGLNFVISPDAPTVESITIQRRKFQETQRLNRILHSEVTRNNALIKQLKSLLSPPASVEAEQPETPAANPIAPYPAFAFLQNKASLTAGTATTPLGTTTAFAISQLPALKTLLAELRPQMKALAQPPAPRDPNVNGTAKETSWRKERLEYVESQTLRLQVNARGLELGPQGEVRDGEWQEQGRKLGKGEVDALERIVAMIGGNTGDNEMDEGA